MLRKSGDRRFVLLVVIMLVVTILSSAITAMMLCYNTLQSQRNRLREMVRFQTVLIQTIVSHEEIEGYHDSSVDVALQQIQDTFAKYAQTGLSSEMVLAESVEGQIVFYLTRHTEVIELPLHGNQIATPMQRALQGQSGSMFGLDYDGQRVLAAYAPLSLAGRQFGVVSKIKLVDLYSSFVWAALWGSLAMVALIMIGALLFRRVSDTYLHQIEKESHYRKMILEFMLDAIITIDEHGIIQSFNPGAERIFGYSAAEALGQNISLLMPEPFKSKHDGYLRRYIQSGKARVLCELSRSVPAMRKDGTVFPAELTANEMRLDGRHYFVGAIRDITARKRDITARKEAEKRLHTEEMARQSAEEANRLKSEFLNNMSHELRTPLHAILGFSQLGAGHLSDLSLQKLGMYFAQINQAGQRLLLLVNDLLDLSKLEAGMMSFELKQCDLGRVLDQVKSEIAVLLPSKHLKLTVQQETVDLGGWFDHDLILRVLVNLLSNAVKFSPEHGEIVIFIRNGKIKSGTGQSVPALEVEVCDQGAGITLGDEEAIFDKFVQSGKQRAGQGTGLGLAICREIITRHQGKIWACNRQTGGAALSFTLLRQLS